MMRKIMVVFAVIVVLGALSSPAGSQGILYGTWEEPIPEQQPVASWYGSTGLIVTPTALMCPPHQIQSGWHQINFDTKNQRVYGANVGITPQMEVGVTRVQNVPLRPPAQTGYTDETILNAKYKLDVGGWFNNPLAPDVAIGVWDWANDLNRAYYLVMSREVPMAQEVAGRQLNVHLGVGNNDRNAGPLEGIFFGADLVPFESSLLQLEYDGDNLNGALRYYPANWISLDAGIVDDNFGWGIGVGSNF